MKKPFSIWLSVFFVCATASVAAAYDEKVIGPDNFSIDPSTSLEELVKDSKGSFAQSSATSGSSEPAKRYETSNTSAPIEETFLALSQSQSQSGEPEPVDAAPDSVPVTSGTSPALVSETVTFTPKPLIDTKAILPGNAKIRMSGQYRVALGATSDDVIFTDANSDLQERNFRYIFGEDQVNTYDPAIYDKFLLNVDANPAEHLNLHTKLVVDPWSFTGTTGEQETRSDQDQGATIRYNLKYFGANNSVLNEVVRATNGDMIAFPLTKVVDGHTTSFTSRGFRDFNPATNGLSYTVPELDIDYEFRPFRELWADYDRDTWHARVFAFAGESQALTTDDPLGLSNRKDYWQQSPWLYEYKPMQHFSDGSVKRGYYSDSLSFLARDSEGNRLVLLKGASVEANWGETYFASTVAAPHTPWDEEYFSANNVPGAARIKHRVSDRLTIGGTYTFRTGLVNQNVADHAQAAGFDMKYKVSEDTVARAEIAGSHRERDRLQDERYLASEEGYGFRLLVDKNYDPGADRHRDLHWSVTQMQNGFDPVLSRYTNTRDDHFWGMHLNFHDYSPDLESFRIGDGIDLNRTVARFQWKERMFKDRFVNLFDIRNVHKTDNLAFKETVVRDEITYKFTPKLTGKAMVRWHNLPDTTPHIEPFISSFYVPDVQDPLFQNIDVPADVNADRYTYSGGLQYVFNPRWTAEGFYERTNNIPDFPRGLLNSSFRDANTRVDDLLFDRVTNLLYGQTPLGGVPPYDYFNIWRERLIYSPQENLRITFHAAQNGYKYAAAIDDNVNHEGLSVAYDVSKKLSLFFDYTHSRVNNLPHLIATNYAEERYEHHHNFYTSLDYKMNAATVLRAEYGVFGLGLDSPLVTPYSVTSFSLPTLDTEHLFRLSLTGDF